MSFHTGIDENLIGGLTLDQLLARARGMNNYAAGGAHELLMKGADAVPIKRGGATLSRLAGSKGALRALKFATPLAAAGGVLGVGDVLFGGDSAANKVMDTAGMAAGAWGGVKGAAAGAAAGSVVPVVGTAAGAIMGGLAGAGIGKMGSDGLQWLFGDKKTPEQRKLEEALIALRGGVV